MPAFSGFPGGKVHLTPIPAPFFSEILPAIDTLAELKVTLYAFWFLDQQEGDYRYLTRADFDNDRQLMQALGSDPQTALTQGLQQAVQRGTLIEAHNEKLDQSWYFLNSPRGRSAARLAAEGKWKPGSQLPASLTAERPNIFRLYEENIGPLTPILSDTLKEAETTYPADWIADAFRIAVHKNARTWRYIEAILKSWQEKGRYETNRRNSQEDDYRKYIEGDFADFIEH
jgi:DNA replication protein